MCTIGPLRGIGFLNDFQHAHPGIDVTLLEGVPGKLGELLHEGSLDVAVMAQPGPFDERFDVHKLYREHFVIAFPPGHRFEAQNAIRFKDVQDETYLRRINCEYRDHLGAISAAVSGSACKIAYRSEREDWIQTMVMAGMGICFMPEYSTVVPGLQTRRVVDPEVSPRGRAGDGRRAPLLARGRGLRAGDQGLSLAGQRGRRGAGLTLSQAAAARSRRTSAAGDDRRRARRPSARRPAGRSGR